MVARFAGASLGLLAFTVTLVAGLVVRNPVEVTLSRAIFALFLFCLLGVAVGGAAQVVLADRQRARESEVRRRYEESVDKTDAAVSVDPSIQNSPSGGVLG